MYHVQGSAKEAVEIARKFFPDVESKWADAGLDEIIQDSSILGVAVVLAGQTQVSLFLCVKFVVLSIMQKPIIHMQVTVCISF